MKPVANYARITHRFAMGAAAAQDEDSRALAELLERRVVESIVTDCRPNVTSDLLSERLQQAVGALAEHGVALRIESEAVVIEACFCESDACQHPAVLLGRLLGVTFESIITGEQRALRLVGALDAARYT